MMLRSIENSPLEHRLETDLNIYGGTYSIDSVRQPFIDSFYFDSLRQIKPRFYTTAWTNDLDKFTKLQGPDVNPVEHGPYQARTVAIPMIDTQNDSNVQFRLKNEGAEHFVAYHVQHDDHEGVFAKIHNMDHDVPTPEKTEITEKEEHKLWLNINNQLFEDSSTMEQYVYEFEYGNSFLGKFWKISEQIGYVASGLQALHLAQESTELSRKERKDAYTMARLVIGRSLGIIEAEREQIPYADHFISSNEDGFKSISEYFDIDREGLYI